MKKIISLFVVLLGILVVGIKGVKADTVSVTRDYIDGVWSYHYRNGDWWTFGNLPFNYADGKLIYCIEPDSRINTDVYYTYDDFELSGFSDEDRRQMELISYYGYGYPGHESIKYYMATQELIWLFSPDDWIKWTVSDDEYSDEIDINYEKSEILRLMSIHDTKPSFYGINYESATNTLFLKDRNNVLEKYDIEVPPELTYELNNNQINFNASKLGTYTIHFKKKRIVNERTLVYNNDSLRTQKLAVFGEPDFEEFSINLTFKGAYVEILKKDADTQELITDLGNKIKIKNITTDKYVKDSDYEFYNGKIWLHLPVGKYKIEETTASDGYYINNDGLEFEIEENGDSSKYLDFYNNKVEGRININKTDEEGNNISGVKFEIYNEDNEVVDTLVTDDSKTTSKLLPLGKYIIKEVETKYGYVKNDNIFEVELKYNNQDEPIVYEDIDVINEKIKCEIVLITTSDEEVLNTSFNIYDKNNNLVYSGNTSDGKATFFLPYGEYILKEIDVPYGYKLNDEEIKFEVNDITCESNFKINNEKIIMPDTTTQNSLFLFILLFINIGSYVYYKKNC